MAAAGRLTHSQMNGLSFCFMSVSVAVESRTALPSAPKTSKGIVCCIGYRAACCQRCSLYLFLERFSLNQWRSVT